MLKETLKIIGPLLVLAFGIVGYSIYGKPAKPPQQEPDKEIAETVLTAKVERFVDKIRIDFDGLVVPLRQIRLSAEINGQVTSKPKELQAGSFVQKDAELLVIDQEFYELEVARLKAERDQAQEAVKELEVQIQNTQDLVNIAQRQLQLEDKKVARSENLKLRKVITEAELEADLRTQLTAQNSLTNLLNQKRQLEQQVQKSLQMEKIAEAKLKQAERDLSKSVIKSPIAGLIVEDNVEQDDFVQRGTQLFLIEDTSQVEISCNLKMEDFGWMLQSPPSSSSAETETKPEGPISSAEAYNLPDHEVTISYELAGVTYEWDGYISRLAGSGLDPKTRMVPCRVTVPEPRKFRRHNDSQKITSRSPRTLMNGMFVSLESEVVPARPLLSIPEQAVRPGNVVWLHTEDGLKIVTVDVAHRQDGQVLVHAENAPLAAGDQVIVSQLAEPKEGMPTQLGPEADDEKDRT